MVVATKGVVNLLPKTVAKSAEFYASRFGWRVFPLYEMSSTGICTCNKGADCPSPGKHPRVSIPSGENAVHPATTDIAAIAKWWKRWPSANIGVWLEGSNLIVLDIDKNDKKDGFKGLADIMAHERQEYIPVTLTCDTPSGGKHLYFNYCEGIPNKANSLGPGLDTWHSQHYVIVPPSNHKAGVEYKWGQVTESPIDYPDWLKPRQRIPTAASVGAPKLKGRPAKEKIDPADPDDVERLKHALAHVDATDRDRWVVIGFALARAFEWSDLGFEVYDKWAASAHNYDAKKTREQFYVQSKTVPAAPITCASIFEWAKSHPKYKAWAPSDDRPYEIRERDADQLQTLIDIGAIVPHFPIYQRSSNIVEIVPINQDKGVTDAGTWYPKGSYVLRKVAAEQLGMRILPSRSRWLRKGAQGWKSTSANLGICSAFLNIGNWPTAHKLRAFVQHPTLRDDGTLLEKRGYDQKSGLFLTEELPIRVNKKASKNEALKAMIKLTSPFKEFKWVDGSVSAAALMASLFTVGIRHLFDEGVPLFAVDAPRQGSGKTKIVKSISNLWFGRPMAVTPYTSDPEEMKKQLCALLMSGERVVLFDNVSTTTRVNDSTLNALLTSGRSTFRELGSQRMLDIDSTATFFMTGNNLRIVGDMIRRTIRLQIDPEGLHPMDRKFKIDPLETYVLDHRVELLSAALTVLIAFHKAGCPKPRGSVTLASFDRWGELVRNMLLWLGMDDVKECISQGYEQDDESNEIEHLLRVLFQIPQLSAGGGLSNAMLLPHVKNNKALEDAMMVFLDTEHGYTTLSHPRQVNTILSKVAKILVDGKRLLRLGPVWAVRDQEA